MKAEPEVVMNIQIARRNDGYVIVVGGRIAIVYDGAIIGELNSLNEIVHSPPDRALENYGQRLERWTEGLRPSDSISPVSLPEALAALSFIHLGPRYPLATPRPPPGITYGHLPFRGVASGNEVFYRYEPYPTSLRIDRMTNSVVQPNTCASPQLDATFVNSGLGAVARYALPHLLPASWRYELRPPPGTAVHYGASVPLFGQSGGGVEVSFPSTFINSGPIPPPLTLPIF
jgi:hypothetical protein